MKKTSYIIIAFWVCLFIGAVGVLLYIRSDVQPYGTLQRQLTGDSVLVARTLPPFRHLVVTMPGWDTVKEVSQQKLFTFKGHLAFIPAERAEECDEFMQLPDGDTPPLTANRMVCPRYIMDHLRFSTTNDTLRIELDVEIDDKELRNYTAYRNVITNLDNWHFTLTRPLQSIDVRLPKLTSAYHYLQQDSLVVNTRGNFSLIRSDVGALDLRKSCEQHVYMMDSTHVERLYGRTAVEEYGQPRIHFADGRGQSRVDCEIYSGTGFTVWLDSGYARRILWQPE